jgi:hypothetical protein
MFNKRNNIRLTLNCVLLKRSIIFIINHTEKSGILKQNLPFKNYLLTRCIDITLLSEATIFLAFAATSLQSHGLIHPNSQILDGSLGLNLLPPDCELNVSCCSPSDQQDRFRLLDGQLQSRLFHKRNVQRL